jgi:hypothetical protein
MRAALSSILTLATTSLVLVAGLAIFSGPAASAATPRASTSGALCNASVSAGTGEVVGSLIVGVTAGATKITFDCNTSSEAGIAAEASLLGGVSTLNVSQAAIADVGALTQFKASTTDTGCPAATAGQCTISVFSVPATFSATDPKAVCPPSQAEINAGVYACVVAVATVQEAPIAGAEYLMTYASEATPPNAPTIASTVAGGPAGSTITVSDAAANTGYWWGNAVQNTQAVETGQTPMTDPSVCGSGGGYGDVPSPFLSVNWQSAGASAPIVGSAAGISISNDCYDGTTLYAPVLSGTIPVPSSVVVGSTYTVNVCELNLTAFPSNDPNALTDCGPAPSGASWIRAAFSYAVTTGTPQAALSITSVAGALGTPLTMVTSGGSGTGAVSFVAVNGTASGCTITGGALSASSAGTCVVTASRAADSTYLAVSTVPTTVTLTAAPSVVKLVTTSVKLAPSATVLPVKISCSGSKCTGSLSASTSVTVRKKKGSGTVIVKETLSFGTVNYSLAAGSTGTVNFKLGKATLSLRKAGAPHLRLEVAITDNLGKKHTYLGRVSLLK